MTEVSANPVFVIGCPRSGNTLLGAILNRHPDLLVLFETNVFAASYRHWVMLCRRRQNTLTRQQAFVQVMDNTFAHYNSLLDINLEQIEECSHKATDWGGMLDAYMLLVLERAKPGAQR